MDIIISNASKNPIYEQISGQIKRLIIDGVLQAGDALPSMRVLAKDLRISVITTKRAYEELERDGFIETVTGKGSFIAQKNSALIREEQCKHIEFFLSQALEAAKRGGVTLPELHEMLNLLYQVELTNLTE